MDITGFIIFLVIGGVAGWLAGTIMKGGGFGLLGNILIGIAGGIVGGFLFRLLVIAAGGLIGSMVTAIVGAVGLLYVIGLFKNRKESSI
jgi:uncharacterized membrane protein YeaQ/YmgE (transglycosylase-associated protein family)